MGKGLTEALKALKDSMELLTTRQTLIRIVDRFELGWKVVDEYEADELTSGNEDERKLERAERTAERKLVKKWKTTGSGPGIIQEGSDSPRLELIILD